MVVKDERIEKTCCFYVSEFHLEMILVPYIKERIEENITILTQINLENTIQILLSRINLKNEEKQKILNLKWNGEENIQENSNIIIIGSEEFIKNKNKKIKNKNPKTILDCYDLELIGEKIDNIAEQYKNTLNTLGSTANKKI